MEKKLSGTSATSVKCPPEIAKLLELVNAVRFNATLPTVLSFVSEADRRTLEADSSAWADVGFTAFNDFIESLRRNPDVANFRILDEFFVNSIYESNDQEMYFGASDRFHEVRDFVASLVDHSEADRDLREKHPAVTATHRYYRPNRTPVVIAVENEGPRHRPIRSIQLLLVPALQPVIGKDLRRFRQCSLPECRRFFWADRLERMGCTDAHNATLRKWRSRYEKAKAEVDRLQLEMLQPDIPPELLQIKMDVYSKHKAVVEKYHVAKKKKW